jgi:riboflavin kinase/FMN adenylyltransferase
MKYTSKVISGHGRGKSLGFPTLNLEIPKSFPYQPGIYAGWVYLNQPHQGAFHYGPIPAFHQDSYALEVFVLETDIPTPPAVISFELLHYLRPIKNFDSPQDLSTQIASDVAITHRLLNKS